MSSKPSTFLDFQHCSQRSLHTFAEANVHISNSSDKVGFLECSNRTSRQFLSTGSPHGPRSVSKNRVKSAQASFLSSNIHVNKFVTGFEHCGVTSQGNVWRHFGSAERMECRQTHFSIAAFASIAGTASLEVVAGGRGVVVPGDNSESYCSDSLIAPSLGVAGAIVLVMIAVGVAVGITSAEASLVPSGGTEALDASRSGVRSDAATLESGDCPEIASLGPTGNMSDVLLREVAAGTFCLPDSPAVASAGKLVGTEVVSVETPCVDAALSTSLAPFAGSCEA